MRVGLLSLPAAALLLWLAAAPVAPLQAAGKSKSLDQFAKCLGEKKATMYGAFFCDHCADQKELFGDSFKYVPYVECVEKGTRKVTQECKNLGIRKTPTWIFADGERRVGLQPLSDLSQKTGCKLP